MSDPGIERLTRTQALRVLLYPVIFSPDLSIEADRVSHMFRTYPQEELAGVIQGAKAELTQPLLQVACIERLESNPTEDQVRAYLTAVVLRLEAISTFRVGT